MFYSIATDQIVLIVLVVLLVAVLVIMPIFTNKKRQQSVNNLHGSLKIGDKIMTIGGIIGVVTAINQTSPVDKEIVIETGVGENKTTMLLDIKALYQVLPAVSANYTAVSGSQSGDAEAIAVFEDTPDVPAESANSSAPASPEAPVDAPAAPVEEKPVAAKPSVARTSAARTSASSAPKRPSTKK